VHADGYAFACRTVDLSTGGFRVAGIGGLKHHEARPFYWVDLPSGDGVATVLARVAWWQDREVAFHIIKMAACDRLSLAEKMDESVRVGLALSA
jgi:hypothetical protein